MAPPGALPPSADRLARFDRAVTSLAGTLGASPLASTPALLGPTGKPLPPSASYTIRRVAARREGSMKNWIPARLANRYDEALERERIAERAADLAQSDSTAAGIIDAYAATVIGSGLTPHPMIDPLAVDLDKNAIRALQARQRAVYAAWAPFADAGLRMSFGGLQYLCMRSLVQHGEYILLVHMIDDPTRPYSLALQAIHPLRLKTPVDLTSRGDIHDGVELDTWGAPSAYWIKKADPSAPYSADIAANFVRIPARAAHRWNVIHRFVARTPEEVRGVSWFAPVMKLMRDQNDHLDAELVSNVVTAALSLAIEVGAGKDPYNYAANLASLTETDTAADGTTTTTRYQEMIPGQVMYLNTGETPHLLAANRPGTSFEPFVQAIKKAIAMGVGVPYPVLFKDVENVNYAGFRAAMLDAWRVFMMYRTWMGESTCQPIYTMLQEEAYLRGHFDAPRFYANLQALTRSEWRGSPKGDIEPIKAAQADILLIEKNLKTRAAAIAERGGDLRTTLDQLEEEEEMLRERGLTEEPLTAEEMALKDDDAPGAVDDMEGAGTNPATE